MRTKKTIQYEKYSCCFQCGLPQEICWRYEQASQGFWQLDSNKKCQLAEVAMPTMFGLAIARGDSVGKSMIQRMNEEGVNEDVDEEVNKWLGGKIRWGGLESNRMTRDFYRVVVEVERER